MKMMFHIRYIGRKEVNVNNIPKFECLIRRGINSIACRLKTFSSKLISAIENYWLLNFDIWKSVRIDKLFLY